MTSNVNLNTTKNGAPPRVTLTVTINGTNDHMVKLGATTIIASVKGEPFAAACQYLRSQSHDDSAYVDFIMPLAGGGSHTVSLPISYGLTTKGG